jgi:HEPN domain-containing protein
LVRLCQDTVPRTHHVGDLIDALPEEYQARLTSARQLTIYATASRYPDEILEVQERHLDEAITIAAAVVEWARTLVRPS